MYNNPFKYSNDNKRYHTFNYHLKSTYQQKVFKVPLNANFSCPNRDGEKAYGGCTFCSALGSGDFAGNIGDDMITQFNQGEEMMRRKWPDGLAIAYFQAYTNTYAPLDILKQHFEPFAHNERVCEISIATRADALNPENIAYLQSLTKYKTIWVELGLQTTDDTIAATLNRGHTYQEFLDAIDLLAKTDIKVCVHLMNSLPDESVEQMIENARLLGKLKIDAIKIHMLHLLKNTRLANSYLKTPFYLLSEEEYIDVVIKQLEVLPPEMIIQRLTGDAKKEDLVAPLWTLNKTSVLNGIDKKMKALDTYQGRLYEE